MALAGAEAERILCSPPASAGNLEIVPAALGAAAGLALAHEFAFTEVVPSRQGTRGLCRASPIPGRKNARLWLPAGERKGIRV
jgi:hypothetical protein